MTDVRDNAGYDWRSGTYSGWLWKTERLSILNRWWTFDRDKWFELDSRDAFNKPADCIVLTEPTRFDVGEQLNVDWYNEDVLVYTVTMAPHLRWHTRGRTYLTHPEVEEATRLSENAEIEFDPPTFRDIVNPTFLLFGKVPKDIEWHERDSMCLRVDNLPLTKDPSWQNTGASFTDNEFILDRGASRTILIVQDHANYAFNHNMWNIYHHPDAEKVARRFPDYNILSIRKRDPMQNVFKYGFAGYENYSTDPASTAKRVQSTFPGTEWAVATWCAGVHGALQLGLDIDAYSICLFDRFMHCMLDTPMYRAAFTDEEQPMIAHSLMDRPNIPDNVIHCFEVEAENNQFNDTQRRTLLPGQLEKLNRHYFGRKEYEKAIAKNSKKGNLFSTALYKNGFMHLSDYV